MENDSSFEEWESEMSDHSSDDDGRTYQIVRQAQEKQRQGGHGGATIDMGGQIKQIQISRHPQDAAAIPTTRNSSSVKVHAQLVNDDDSNTQRNLNIALQQENQRLRQRLDIPTATIHEEKPSAGDCCSKNIPILVAFALILMGIGLGAFFATQSAREDASPSTISLSSTPPTAAPTIAPPPVFGQLPEFDPPSAADCEAVISGGLVKGQEEMEVRTYELELDVSLSVALVVHTVSEAVTARTGEVVIPQLVGCDDDARRQLRRLVQTRYAIANAYLTGSPTDFCVGTTNICYTLVLELDLFLKSSKLRDFEVISFLFDEFSGDLVDRLGLGGSFDTIEVKKITAAPRPTLAPMSQPVTPDDEECDASCRGNQSCQDLGELTTVGCNACIGDNSCVGMAEGVVGDDSCIGDYSCSHLLEVEIEDDSCIDPYSCACLAPGSYVSPGSCQNSGECCTANGSPLNVPPSSCSAQGACQFASGPIGSRSCNGGSRTCWGSKAAIGNDSCNDGGCTGLIGEVESFSCNGAGACPEGREVFIAQQSCNCDGCCSCLTEPSQKFGAIFVPPQSCNSLAPNDEEIDYSLDKLTPGYGQLTYCCSA